MIPLRSETHRSEVRTKNISDTDINQQLQLVSYSADIGLRRSRGGGGGVACVEP